MQMNRNSFLRLILLSFFTLVSFTSSVFAADGPYRIAMYKGGGVSKYCQYVVDVVGTDPGLKLEIVNEQQIRAGILEEGAYDIVLLPGGLAYKQIEALQPEGMTKIKEFIKSGKSYLGICAGAYVPIKENFMNAEFKSPKWWRGMGNLKIEFSELGVKLAGEKYQGVHEIRYANGPVININVDPRKPKCEVLAWFRTEFAEDGTEPGIQIDSPAIVLMAYEKGLVVTVSPHPERTPAMNDVLLNLLHHLGKSARGERPAEDAQTEDAGSVVLSDAERTEMREYMRAMAEVTWVPKEDITWFRPKNGVIFHAGETYKGLPYTQDGRLTNLELFKEFLTDENGKPVYGGPTASDEYRGSDCSAACSYAWRHVIPNFPVLKTWHMEPGAFCLVDPKTGFPEPVLTKVGDYQWTDFHDSLAVIKENGEEKIMECYRQLKPGDGVVKRPYGHVRLVSRLDAENQKVYVIEQCGLTPEGQLKSDHQSWRVEYECSFRDLLDEGYLPIRPSKKVLFDDEN